MHDAMAVGVPQSAGDLQPVFDDAFQRNLPPGRPEAANILLQRAPGQILQRQETLAFVFLDGIDGGDMGMIERGDGPCLAKEPAHRVFGVEQGRPEKFQCDEAVEAEVAGLENNTDPALAEFLEDFVTRSYTADGARASPVHDLYSLLPGLSKRPGNVAVGTRHQHIVVPLECKIRYIRHQCAISPHSCS